MGLESDGGDAEIRGLVELTDQSVQQIERERLKTPDIASAYSHPCVLGV